MIALIIWLIFLTALRQLVLWIEIREANRRNPYLKQEQAYWLKMGRPDIARAQFGANAIAFAQLVNWVWLIGAGLGIAVFLIA